MNYGYPGSNTQLENHNVSEESFWPSFTDIMMVIVMVFLLVTVAVILNNWTLISQLTNSIEAQEQATALADNRQIENENLESKLSTAQKNLLALNSQYDKEKSALEETQKNLSTAAQTLLAKEQSLASIETKLSALSDKYEAEQKRLSSTNQQLTASEEKLSNSDKQLVDLKKDLAEKIATISSLNKRLGDSDNENIQLKTSVTDLKKETESLSKLNQNNKDEISQLKTNLTEKEKATIALQTDRNTMDKKLSELLSSVKLSKKQLAENQQKTEQKQTEFLEKLSLLEKDNEAKIKTIEESQFAEEKLKLELAEKVTEVENLQNVINETQETAKTIELNVSKSQESLKSFETLLTTAEKQIIERDKQIAQLKSAQEEGSSQLKSLQGEYDTLDTKYQKLVRPARSSKGKYVASVTYKKTGGKRVIRYKSGPSASYRTVSSKQLAKSLESLKKKHKDNLYVKVVIPEKSGLSYNEAWKFTINLQRKYDYYYNK